MECSCQIWPFLSCEILMQNQYFVVMINIIFKAVDLLSENHHHNVYVVFIFRCTYFFWVQLIRQLVRDTSGGSLPLSVWLTLHSQWTSLSLITPLFVYTNSLKTASYIPWIPPATQEDNRKYLFSLQPFFLGACVFILLNWLIQQNQFHAHTCISLISPNFPDSSFSLKHFSVLIFTNLLVL